MGTAVGCSWTDAARTVCSVCAPAAKAEARGLRLSGIGGSPAREAAYHRGFVIGWFGVHGNFRRNPYADGPREAAARWDRGLLAGEATSRQHQLACGRLENAPRRGVLSFTRPATRHPAGRLTRRARG